MSLLTAFRPLLALASREKSLEHGLLAHPGLNRLGLHAARIAATDACLALRRRLLLPVSPAAAYADLARDGIAVVPDILPAPLYAAARAEAAVALSAARDRHPLPVDDESGFGRKRPFPGGFDRFDGSTLNRFLDIDPACMPALARAIREPLLASLCRLSSGFLHHPPRFQLYQTVHGDEVRNPDIQRVAHRDTYHSTVKLWLFLEDVTPAQGPFMYAPGSHRMTPARYRWEYRRACLATRSPGHPDRGGSFRIAEQELPALGLQPLRAYPVRGNTLVLADVRGFHRRGDAAAGMERVALYANLRLWPFAPLPY